MSTQQIPSAAQIAAARSALWHQNTPEPASLSEPGNLADPAPSTDPAPSADATSNDLPPATESQTEAASAPEISADPAGDSQVEAVNEAADTEPQHPGIDISDPESEAAKSSSVPPASVAILTQSGAREFINRAGLLLFSAKPQFSGVPAPTFVEATLGAANANPSLAAAETARTLLARLVADGSAVPLNLLGLPATTAEAPDFIASAAAFPYIFTLRGDKAWKQPPSTSGATKVSPLAANTFTLLVENGPKSAYDLVSDLGKEVTEAAVLRALSELWQQLRVLPVPQGGNKPTVWEPITTRFTKQIKTGANAGQPTALSTFVSLFLGQSLLATEDEIETFLSPLAPRSRIRDVVHALSGARQLETITIEGKHHLHIAGDLPLFASAQPVEAADTLPVLSEDGSRIKKFVPKPRKLGTGSADRPKPFRAPSDRSRPDSRPARRSSEGRSSEGRSSEGRPASRFAAGSARPAFNKPWDEEKQARTDRAAAASSSDTPAPEYQDIDLDAGAQPERPQPRPSRPAFGSRPAYGSKPAFGSKPSFSRKPPFGDRPGIGGDRPAFSRDRPGSDRPAFNRDRPGSDRPAFNRDRPSFDRGPREGGSSDRFQPRDSRRDFTPHPSAGGGGDARPPRHFGNKPSFGGKPGFGNKPGFAGKPSFPRKPFDPERSAGDRERRPFRRDDGAAAREDSRPPRRTFDSGSRSGGPEGRPPFAGKPRFSRDGDGGGSSRPPFRKFDAPRPSRDGDSPRLPRRSFDNDRPAARSNGFAGAKPFGAKPFARREGSDSAPRREGFTPREGGGSFPRREGGFAGKREGSGFAGKKSFTARPAPGGGGKPFKKPLSRSAPDAPGASTFDKFKGNAKPWGKRPPARKYKPRADEA